MALGKILTGMVFKYLFVLANGNDSRQNGIFPQQATDVGKLRAHNREAWLGGKDQDDVANPRSGFLLEGDVAHVKGHLGAVLGRPVIL